MLSRFLKYGVRVVLCACAVTLASCLISQRDFQQVRYYDLGNPPAINHGGPWPGFSRIHVKGPYKSRMVFRGPGNELKLQEFHRWASEPEALLERYLAMAFAGENPDSARKTLPVSVQILVFEADEPSSHARLSVEYTIGEGSDSRSFFRSFSEKMTEVSPEPFALAMAECVAAFARQIKSDIESMPN